MESVSSSSGSQFMLLSSEHLLSVSIKNRSSAGERKSRYSEEKKREEKKREEKKRDMSRKLWEIFLFRNAVFPKWNTVNVYNTD